MKREIKENTLIVDEDSCKKYGFSVEEFLTIALVKTGVNIGDLIQRMISKGILYKNKDLLTESLHVSSEWDETFLAAAFDKDPRVPTTERLANLATALIEVFPVGRKEGTAQYWRGNKRDIMSKLEKFFKRYGDLYTDEQLIEAARKYVDSHNGNYSYMRVLKYFIWKDERRTHEDGTSYIEEVSDLASFIENSESEDNAREDWMSTLT